MSTNLTDDEIRELIANILFPMFPTYLEGGELRHRYPSGNTGPSHLYDKSVDAALTLCYRLREEGWSVYVAASISENPWTVGLTKPNQQTILTHDPSLARAICLAFLKVQDLVARSP